MNKKIIIFSILSVLIIGLLPSINAMEYNIIKENNSNRINNLFSIELKNIKNYFTYVKADLNNIISSPQCFAIPYAILTFIILCLIFGVIGVFGTAIAFIINVIIGFVTSIFGAFFGILSLIFKVVAAIMNGTMSTIAEIISIISTFTAIVVNIIKNKFANLKAFIILLIGLTIDILKIIYDTLFPDANPKI